MIATLHALAGPWQLAWCALVVLAAYTLRGATGFGAGVVAIPLLVLVLPMQIVIPVVTTLGIGASFGQTMREFHHVEWRGVRGLLVPMLVGAGAGLWLFKALHPELLRGALALFIIGYALWSVAPRAREPRAPRAWLAPVAGAGGGLVSTLFGGMAGPMFVVYLDALRLDKTRFRATISAILFLLALLRAGGYGSLGFYDLRALAVLALLAPAMLLGMVLGEHAHHGLNEKLFSRVVAALLVASGCTLLLK
ncbi:MAG TPA: sulfite exporter TauE/SafE family protein [Burkholderiales bacterium]|nr:sulfite exporter TauE/SafE family protein [Burkholderiales bacterium]